MKNYIICIFLLIFLSSCLGLDKEKKMFRNLEGKWYLDEGILSKAVSLKDSIITRADGVTFTFEKCSKKNGTGVGPDPCKVRIFDGKGKTYTRAIRATYGNNFFYIANIGSGNTILDQKNFDDIWSENYIIEVITADQFIISETNGYIYGNKTFKFVK